ncbi:MAG: hypothetical protein CM15mP42_12870 [Methanobacteriota archaeon]|nr:MAG: hypothetical protein CM15mP42_12870 [Euryarchaeota archaeon]
MAVVVLGGSHFTVSVDYDDDIVKKRKITIK